ncbi:chromosome partition protein smc [Bacillus sp. OxB-1]|uniref:chromosome segregation protein SMC n=1 Tax=Bacillus sp. (strain OxB-1) TaxID=98228 RepID=UPI000581F049|nr:chromosome segregation protein SMC [Bacillus sp. OxB-1]BAQ10486.1 chromosome partition protein smc [Bacillus sp. OxB-1]
MFLKRLEIIGFKSFAERIGIDFVPGVTAVVGPNGSGKSNITDAIRWVLGEQSAKSLRGSKMEDVIFAGSDSRKPLNFAEVTLVLDNSQNRFPLDYTEISVSRRVFRSGESAYLLNGQQCRLKDITDVFMDSGLGKEAFSIISQGRIDEILNSRPEERRTIFDEAAGVLKYRTRKRKAEHKLFETEDNLDRVLDILKELDTRIGPLEKSAQAAKTYNVLSEEIRELDVRLLNLDTGKLREEILQTSREAERLQQEKNRYENDVRQMEQQSTVFNAQLAQVDEEMEKLQKKLVTVSAEAEKWEGRRLLSLEKKRNAEQQILRLQTELESAVAEQGALAGKIGPAIEQLEQTEQEYAGIAGELDAISQVLKRSAKETEAEIEELKSLYIERLNEEATLRNDLKHLEERLEGERTSSERILQQTALLREKLRELKEERKAKASSLSRLEQQYEAEEAAYQQALEALHIAEKELASQQEMMQKALNRQHEMSGRVRALESMEADFSGFYSGVKEVLLAKRAGKLSGIDGAVAELISVDPEFVKAVETALGGALQHLVTTTEAEARKAIGYLKSKNAGRATFLPRDVMKPRTIPTTSLYAVKQHPEFIATADRLVQTNEAYRGVTENLLGNTLVAQTLTGASAIAKLMNYRFRVVTIDGDIVNAGGSLTGGGVKGQASVFTRKAELETLKKQLHRMEESLKTANRKLSDTKMDVAKWMQETGRLREEMEKHHVGLAAAQSGIREVDITIKSIEQEIAVTERGRQGAEHSGSELMGQKSELQNKHLHVKEELESIQSEVQTLERLASDRRNEESALIAKQSNLRERSAVLREQRTYQQASIAAMEESAKRLAEKILRLQEELQFFHGSDEGGELTADEIQKRIEGAVQEKSTVEQELIQKRESRVLLSQQLEEKGAELRQLRDQAGQAVSALNTINVALSRLEVKYEGVTQRLLDDYGLYPEADFTADFDEQQARERVEMLKSELEALGPVNQGAIPEFEEVTERHRFLSEQRNDLLEAKGTLQEAMSEMDREMKTRFSTTFAAVRQRFRHVFREMFGGGEADLLLTDPDDLLETGVDIMARPPGKKLQNLSLLSGGERALTAIALLFSIIEVRPVPFCILDEVEAALDEANVIRYSKYLKKFSEKTQFIVITHRKGTMEGADVLYGVTMQESGVSRLISVKLSEVPEGAIM